MLREDWTPCHRCMGGQRDPERWEQNGLPKLNWEIGDGVQQTCFGQGVE